MRELDKVFETFQIDIECENEDNIGANKIIRIGGIAGLGVERLKVFTADSSYKNYKIFRKIVTDYSHCRYKT